MRAEASDGTTIPALERGLRLLCEFDRSHPSFTALELAGRLGIPRTTIFRMMNTLEGMGFVRKKAGTSSYELDMAVLRLGFEYLASLDLTEIGRPLLDRLRDETGLSSTLAIRDRQSVVIVAKASAPMPFASTVFVGSRLPAHATVLGRALLGDFELNHLRTLYPDERLPLDSASPSTPIVSVGALYELLVQDKSRGYAIGPGFYLGSVTVAAPVRGRNGEIAAAIGVTVPFENIENPEWRENAVINKVLCVTQAFSNLMNI